MGPLPSYISPSPPCALHCASLLPRPLLSELRSPSGFHGTQLPVSCLVRFQHLPPPPPPPPPQSRESDRKRALATAVRMLYIGTQQQQQQQQCSTKVPFTVCSLLRHSSSKSQNSHKKSFQIPSRHSQTIPENIISKNSTSCYLLLLLLLRLCNSQAPGGAQLKQHLSARERRERETEGTKGTCNTTVQLGLVNRLLLFVLI